MVADGSSSECRMKKASSAPPIASLHLRCLTALFLFLLIRYPTSLSAQGTTFTFSRSNLLDGQLKLEPGLTPYEVARAVEEALGLWSSIAPVSFYEVSDSGPEPDVDDLDYSAAGHPDIRVGHHPFDGGVLGHAYSPGNSGLAGDVHLDDSNRVWTESLLFTTLVHELGHALGLDHIDDQLSIMNSTLGGANILPGIDAGYLLSPETTTIQSLWGTGTGEVVSPRHWTGAATSRWTDDDNWQEGRRPTPRSDVYLDQAGLITLARMRKRFGRWLWQAARTNCGSRDPASWR